MNNLTVIDKNTTEDIVKKWEKYLYSIVAIFSKRANVEDLTQEAWVGLLEASQRYNPDSGAQFHTYAWRYVYWKLHKLSSKELSNKHNVEYQDNRYDDSFLEQIQTKDLTQYIFDILSDYDAEIIRMYYIKNMTYRAIGAHLGISRTMVNNHINRIQEYLINRVRNEVINS